LRKGGIILNKKIQKDFSLLEKEGAGFVLRSFSEERETWFYKSPYVPVVSKLNF